MYGPRCVYTDRVRRSGIQKGHHVHDAHDDESSHSGLEKQQNHGVHEAKGTISMRVKACIHHLFIYLVGTSIYAVTCSGICNNSIYSMS